MTNAGPQFNDEDAAAAVLAALQLYLLDEQQQPVAFSATSRTPWREARRLALVGLRPQRLPVKPTWGTIERLQRRG